MRRYAVILVAMGLGLSLLPGAEAQTSHPAAPAAPSAPSGGSSAPGGTSVSLGGGGGSSSGTVEPATPDSVTDDFTQDLTSQLQSGEETIQVARPYRDPCEAEREAVERNDELQADLREQYHEAQNDLREAPEETGAHEILRALGILRENASVNGQRAAAALRACASAPILIPTEFDDPFGQRSRRGIDI